MEFRPLTKEEYAIEREREIKNYENELLNAGMLDKEKAKEQATATFDRLLPNGLDTKNNYIYNVYDQESLVGFIWYAIRENDAFIYDFYVEESMRRKGYGRKIIMAYEADAKNKGAKKSNLHVFGHNKPARNLYESLNYNPVSIQMSKKLE